MGSEMFLSAVSTVGFPIACCVVMGFYVKYITDKNREEVEKMASRHQTEVEKLTDTHRQEMNDVTTAINNNTLALTKLCERMDYEREVKKNA